MGNSNGKRVEEHITTKGIDYEDEELIKLTNRISWHNGVQYEIGLNTDILDFNPRRDCRRGGLYVCRKRDIGRWINCNGFMEYAYTVAFPDDEDVVDMGDKLKAHSIILSDKRYIWQDKELCLIIAQFNGDMIKYMDNVDHDIRMAAVGQYGMALRFIVDQTEEMCLVAVKQSGLAIEHAKFITPEIQLEAVKSIGSAIKFVSEEDQTDEMMDIAVKKNWKNLKYVREQTRGMCMHAVIRNWEAIGLVRKFDAELCRMAIRQNGRALLMIKFDSIEDKDERDRAYERLCLFALDENWRNIQFMRQTEKICERAVHIDGLAIQCIDDQTEILCLTALVSNPESFKFIRDRSDRILLKAVRINGLFLKDIDHQTENLCIEAIIENHRAFRYAKIRSKPVRLEAVKRCGANLAYVREQDEEICHEAIKEDPMSLEYVHNQTLNLCLDAVKWDKRAIKFVESRFKKNCNKLIRELRRRGDVHYYIEDGEVKFANINL